MVDFMKKVVILFLFLVFWSGISNARYERKMKEPDFFIPESEIMHKAEKLPPLKLKRQENVSDTAVNDEANQSLYDIKEIPEYKKKYDQYLADIMIFKNTEKMPENKVLDDDLAAMNSNEKKEITAPNPQKITSKEMGEFYSIYRKILGD